MRNIYIPLLNFAIVNKLLLNKITVFFLSIIILFCESCVHCIMGFNVPTRIEDNYAV